MILLCEFCRTARESTRLSRKEIMVCQGTCGCRTWHYSADQFSPKEEAAVGGEEVRDDCSGVGGGDGVDAVDQEGGTGGGGPDEQLGDLQHPAGGHEGLGGAAPSSDPDPGERGQDIGRGEARALMSESRSKKK